MNRKRVDRFRRVEQRVLDRHLPGAEEHRVEWDGTSVRAVSAGEGPPAVFLHGVTGTLSNLASLAGRLTAGRRCVLVDLPGHGLSGPLTLGRRSPRASLVDAVTTVLDDLVGDTPAGLVGNSLGGMTALWMAVDRPGRVSAVAALGEPAYAFDGARAEPPLNLIGIPVVGRLMLAMPPPPVGVYTRTVGDAFGPTALDAMGRDAIDANRLAVRAGSHARSVAGLMGALMGRRGLAAEGVAMTAEELASIDVPTWFLWGTDDPFMSPTDGRPWVERIPHSTIDVVEGAHTPWFDAPDLTLSRLDELLARRPNPRQ